MERLHPGVYVEEVSSGVRPIEGVGTSTAAFLGKAESGPLDHARLVTSFIQFQAVFGGFLADSYLTHAALSFFANGGSRLFVVRVGKGTEAASVVVGDRKTTPARTLTAAAASHGTWGNALEIVVSDSAGDPGDEFDVAVRRDGAVVEVHTDLSMDPGALNFAENVLNSRSQLVHVTVDTTNESSVAGTSISGSGAATTLPTDRKQLVIDVNGDGAQTVSLAGAVGTGAAIATAIESAVRGLTPLRSSTPAAAFTSFSAEFANDAYTLTSGARGKSSSVQVTSAVSGNAATLLRLGVLNGGAETTGAGVLRPANGTYLLGDGAVAGATLSVTPGSDGSTPQDADYQAALTRLDPVRDVNIVAVPGIGSKQVVAAASGYCQGRADCFFVGDLPSTAESRDAAVSFVNELPLKTSYAAVYFPWPKVVDPVGAAPEPIAVPPSGFVAGAYARTDTRRGVWKAAAGTEANITGAVDLAVQLTDADQDVLNPIGVNVLRFFPASGIVIWGARTLATRSDPEYRYVPIRRLAIFLEQSIGNGIQWAVFEPNDEDLWASLRMNIGAFMTTMFRAGAFAGQTPSQAFFVKCDGQTNPPDQVDAGIVTAQVGFAPLRPAEFVVLRISQKTVAALV